MVGSIGSFYNAKGVVTGQAMGLYAPENTPLPGDSILPFDEASWASTVISLNGATGGNFTISMVGGPLLAVLTTANIASSATNTQVATAITTALNAAGIYNITPVVTGSGTVIDPFRVCLVGGGGALVAITSAGALTGGTGATPTLTAPAWTPCGATEQGWQTSYAPTTNDIRVEEQQTPVGRNVQDATYTFVANLSEDSMENLKLALSATRTITAADTTHFATDELALSQNLPVIAVALETKNRRGFPRRYYIPGATCATNVGQTFARARGQHLVPVTFSSVCAVEDIKVRNIVGNHT